MTAACPVEGVGSNVLVETVIGRRAAESAGPVIIRNRPDQQGITEARGDCPLSFVADLEVSAARLDTAGQHQDFQRNGRCVSVGLTRRQGGGNSYSHDYDPAVPESSWPVRVRIVNGRLLNVEVTDRTFPIVSIAV